MLTIINAADRLAGLPNFEKLSMHQVCEVHNGWNVETFTYANSPPSYATPTRKFIFEVVKVFMSPVEGNPPLVVSAHALTLQHWQIKLFNCICRLKWRDKFDSTSLVPLRAWNLVKRTSLISLVTFCTLDDANFMIYWLKASVMMANPIPVQSQRLIFSILRAWHSLCFIVAHGRVLFSSAQLSSIAQFASVSNRPWKQRQRKNRDTRNIFRDFSTSHSRFRSICCAASADGWKWKALFDLSL